MRFTTPFAHYEVSNGVMTKYYFFAGQRIAMKRDGVLTYLHSDHLGSTVLETNTSGQIVSDQRYYAYGKQRDTGPVGTDHRFTGQKQDASGLVYMNARYYDPVLGQFISPDTLVPDPGVLMDYNRYGYARGNPLKFDDPSGHCATLSSGGADENDAECWTLARTIANMWDDTDYWQTRFGDVGVWNDLIAPSGAIAEFFAGELDMFINSDVGQTWLNDNPVLDCTRAGFR
jgi:RHS repeat-associated protein